MNKVRVLVMGGLTTAVLTGVGYLAMRRIRIKQQEALEFSEERLDDAR